MNPYAFNEENAVSRLMRFLSIEGVTGKEKAIAEDVMAALIEVGVPRDAIHFDDANTRIPLPTQTGNLIVTLPGTSDGPRLMFSTHMDTVPTCAGAKPKRAGKRIVAEGPTALGGDNRTGVGVLVTLAATLIEQKLRHPPITLLFTVREESGLWGARYVNHPWLGEVTMCFNVDGRAPQQITIGAVGADRWEAEIIGKAAHAGVHPEQGISSTAVASIALAEVHKAGWFGKIKRKDGIGTSNVGPFGGKNGTPAGEATNVVTDYVHIRGECRSHSTSFISKITGAYRSAFKKAASKVRDDKGHSGKVRFHVQRDYFPFKLKETAPVVKHAMEAAKAAGFAPETRISNGGLDANWLVRNGIPTITFGAGQNGIHAIGEFVEIADYLGGCRLAIAMATLQHR